MSGPSYCSRVHSPLKWGAALGLVPMGSGEDLRLVGAVTQGSCLLMGVLVSADPLGPPNSPGLWCRRTPPRWGLLPQGVPGSPEGFGSSPVGFCMNPQTVLLLGSLLPSASWASCAASLRSFWMSSGPSTRPENHPCMPSPTSSWWPGPPVRERAAGAGASCLGCKWGRGLSMA